MCDDGLNVPLVMVKELFIKMMAFKVAKLKYDVKATVCYLEL